VSGLVLANAMIFQEILSEADGRVQDLQTTLKKEHLQGAFTHQWEFIVEEINYFAIFDIASKIVINLSSNKYIADALQSLALTAQKIVGMRAALRHDLMGRVYHRLLAERKYLGTYYTSIPAATLLLKLALSRDGRLSQWHDLKHVRGLRVADLACGTGTLLMAAADAITDNYIHESAARARPVSFDAIQNILTEQVLFGYDVLPSAVHLTASTLALRAPLITFKKTNLFSLPLGGPEKRLGSIDFLQGKNVEMPFDLFGAKQVKDKGVEKHASAPLPKLDLCVMNPPFTRSVGGNLLFGSLPADERQGMQTELKKLIGRRHVPASITAGLGSVFVAVADPYIRPGGRIALVLPKALLSGVAWQPTRELIQKQYQLDYVIVSHDPLKWNFSESTSLSEVLIVATKLDGDSKHKDRSVVTVNLWRNPSTAFEALAIANGASQGDAPDLADGQGALNIMIGRAKVGEANSVPWSHLKIRHSWMLPAAFANSELTRAFLHLSRGELWLPGHGVAANLKLSTLGTLARLGPDRRDIHDGFTTGTSKSAYPAFWGHDAKAVLTIAQEPNAYLSSRHRAKSGRPLRKTEQLWPLAGKILIAERLWLKTQRAVCVRLEEEVLSNVWWPLSFPSVKRSDLFDKGLALWLNSTLGLLILLASREETRGAWVDFKKPVLKSLPIPDLSSLRPAKLKRMAEMFDRLGKEPLKPLPEMDSDSVRAEIDGAVAEALGLPDIAPIRGMLANEPIVCLRRL
ncbi:MAG: hypothetical protein HY304_09370, partial [candidate division Zixibacteria bacterium]|nr:hypothetical protein [candidate division Zixibacteria bacterium]